MFTAHLSPQGITLTLQCQLFVFDLLRQTYALADQVGHHLQKSLVSKQRTEAARWLRGQHSGGVIANQAKRSQLLAVRQTGFQRGVYHSISVIQRQPV